MTPITILIVEDDEELRKLLQQRLTEYGYLTDAVENGEALEQKINKKITILFYLMLCFRVKMA